MLRSSPRRSRCLSPTVVSGATAAGVIKGTVAYMSPEQARGLPVGMQTDIWALGCVMFEMLTGHRAFSGATGTDILAAVVTRDPDWADLCPLQFRRQSGRWSASACRKTIQPDPSHRRRAHRSRGGAQPGSGVSICRATPRHASESRRSVDFGRCTWSRDSGPAGDFQRLLPRLFPP